MGRKIKYWIDDLRGRIDYRRYGEKERRKSRISGQIFFIAVGFAATFYLSWCVLNTQWRYWYAAVPFLVTEVMFFILFLLWANILWNKRYHRPEGPLLEKKNFSVDIFIPVCGEPIEIISDTLAAAVDIDYQRKKIFVLDDGNDDGVEALCRQFQVHYLCRPVHDNRKAGNLNYALKLSSGELVLIIDADHEARPEIISRIIGYFSLDKIAFVQTNQQFKLPPGDPWGNADKVFYNVMQPGKDYDNAAISCGSGVMYRRSALKSIGGFCTWNLVEDLTTSMLLHSKGWRSVYHSQGYTRGTAPQEIISHVKQRRQWAVDSLRLFYWDNPFFKKGLNFYQRLQYFQFGYHYLVFGIFLPIFFILPIWALFTHNFMLETPVWRYCLVRLPYFLLYMMSNKITTDRLHSFKVFQAQAGLFAVYCQANFAALFSKNRVPCYTVTNKTPRPRGIWSRIYRCLPHIILVLLSVVAGVYGLMTIKHDTWFLLVNLFWVSWTVMILWRFIVLSIRPELLAK